MLQGESTHSACARVWAVTALSYPYLFPGETPLITPPLLHHSHYLTVTCLTCFSSCSAGPEGLDSIHFSALYSQLPCRCCVQAQPPAQTRRLPAVRIIKSGSLERDPVAAPAQCFSKLIALSVVEKRVLVLAAQTPSGHSCVDRAGQSKYFAPTLDQMNWKAV